MQSRLSANGGRVSLIPTIGSLCVLAIGAGTALAQDQYEWEPDEGWHEEEWYDPSDWFTDEAIDADDHGYYYTIDYEYHDSAYEAYWDGYYDGFYDDVYGYDYWNDDWSANYQTAYTDGYYDGYYDNVRAYDFDPVYYVYAWQEENVETDPERAADATRTRGDRAAKKGKQSRDKKRWVTDRMKMKRVRGTLASMSQADTGGYQDHVVLKVAFQDGTSHVIDFGPRMTRKDMPIEKGERVTLTGKPVTRDGQKVIVVKTMTDDGKTYTLRDGKMKKGAKKGKGADKRNRGNSKRSPNR